VLQYLAHDIVNFIFAVNEPQVFQQFVPNKTHLVNFLPVLRIGDSERIDRELTNGLEEDFATIEANFHEFTDFPVVLKLERLTMKLEMS
jgi:hypothetical protein